ncbi:hypothetical protein HDU85_001618 [Gaertneriomyces sp. JEL0708]|nr:hypothetical protein HDU85_001618 [Gaertneriomyces sp. JEL0708]
MGAFSHIPKTNTSWDNMQWDHFGQASLSNRHIQMITVDGRSVLQVISAIPVCQESNVTDAYIVELRELDKLINEMSHQGSDFVQQSRCDRDDGNQKATQDERPQVHGETDCDFEVQVDSEAKRPGHLERDSAALSGLSSWTGSAYLTRLLSLLHSSLQLHDTTTFVAYLSPSISTSADFLSVLTTAEKLSTHKRHVLWDFNVLSKSGSDQSVEERIIPGLSAETLSAFSREAVTAGPLCLQLSQTPFDVLPSASPSSVCSIIPFHSDDTLVGIVGYIQPKQSLTADAIGLIKEVETRLVAELRRTSEILTLRKKEKAADVATKTKTNFLANMSHEIRTPISAIISLAEMILSDSTVTACPYDLTPSASPMPDPQGLTQEYNHAFCSDETLPTILSPTTHSHLSLILSSSEHLLSVVNGVLDLSKIGAQDVAFKLRLEKVKLRKIVKEAVHLSALGRGVGKIVVKKGTRGRREENHSNHRLMFYWNIDEGVPNWIIADPTRLRQIILNLLTNALKFTSVGSVSLDVKTKSHGDQQVGLLFTITDTGIGIPASKLTTLFKPYSQINNPHNVNPLLGTGLGLAISAALVDMMGGRIWVESEEGQGSAFSFSIECQVAENPHAASESDSTTTSTTGSFESDGKLSNAEDSDSGSSENDSTPSVSRRQSVTTTSSSAMMMSAISATPAAGRPRSLSMYHVAPEKLAGSHYSKPPTPLHYPGVSPTSPSTLLTPSYFANPPSTPHAPSTNLISTEFSEKYPVRILVVEDNPINQQIALSILRKVGYVADLARDGVEALEMFEHKLLSRPQQDDKSTVGYDLILMDLSMPRMGGIECMKHLRKHWGVGSQGHEEVVVIALTASATSEDVMECEESGMHGFLNKPFKAGEVRDVIAKYFGHRTGTATERDASNTKNLVNGQSNASEPDPQPSQRRKTHPIQQPSAEDAGDMKTQPSRSSSEPDAYPFPTTVSSTGDYGVPVAVTTVQPPTPSTPSTLPSRDTSGPNHKGVTDAIDSQLHQNCGRPPTQIDTEPSSSPAALAAEPDSYPFPATATSAGTAVASDVNSSTNGSEHVLKSSTSMEHLVVRTTSEFMNKITLRETETENGQRHQQHGGV